jgi:hypothetical protein
MSRIFILGRVTFRPTLRNSLDSNACSPVMMPKQRYLGYDAAVILATPANPHEQALGNYNLLFLHHAVCLFDG